MEPRDAAAATHVFCCSFAEAEPIFRTTGVTYEDLHGVAAAVVEHALPQGLSLVAEASGDAGVVGMVLVEDFALAPDLDPRGLPERLVPGMSLLAQLAQAYRARHPVRPGHTANGIAVGVLPDHATLGIAQSLIAAAIETVRRRGFKRAIAFLSSPISQHILADRFGWRLEDRIPYQEFELEGRRPLEGIAGVDAMMLRSIDL